MIVQPERNDTVPAVHILQELQWRQLTIYTVVHAGLERQLVMCHNSSNTAGTNASGAGGNATSTARPAWCDDAQLVGQLQQALSNLWQVGFLPEWFWVVGLYSYQQYACWRQSAAAAGGDAAPAARPSSFCDNTQLVGQLQQALSNLWQES